MTADRMKKPVKIEILFCIMAVCAIISAKAIAEDYYDDDSDREKSIERFHEQQVKTFGPGYVRQAAYNAKADYGMSNRVKFLSDVTDHNRPAMNMRDKENARTESGPLLRSAAEGGNISILAGPVYGGEKERIPRPIMDYIEKIRSSGESTVENYAALSCDYQYAVFMENTGKKNDTRSIKMRRFDIRGNALGEERDVVSERTLDSLNIEGIGLMPDKNIALIRSEARTIGEEAEESRLILSLYNMDGEAVFRDMIINDFMMRFDGLQSNINMLVEPGRAIVFWMELGPDGGDYVIKEFDIQLSEETIDRESES